jgi:hypothetical protein
MSKQIVFPTYLNAAEAFFRALVLIVILKHRLLSYLRSLPYGSHLPITYAYALTLRYFLDVVLFFSIIGALALL